MTAPYTAAYKGAETDGYVMDKPRNLAGPVSGALGGLGDQLSQQLKETMEQRRRKLTQDAQGQYGAVSALMLGDAGLGQGY